MTERRRRRMERGTEGRATGRRRSGSHARRSDSHARRSGDHGSGPVADLHRRYGNRTIQRAVEGGNGDAASTDREETTDDAGVRVVARSGDGSGGEIYGTETAGTVYFSRGEHGIPDPAAAAVRAKIGRALERKIAVRQNLPEGKTLKITVTGSSSPEWRSVDDPERASENNVALARRRAAGVRRVIRAYLADRGVDAGSYSVAVNARVGSTGEGNYHLDRTATVATTVEPVRLTEPDVEEESGTPPGYDPHLLNIAVNNLVFMEAGEALVKGVGAALPGVSGAINAGRAGKAVERLLKVESIDDQYGTLTKTQREALKDIKRRTRLEYERLLELNPSYRFEYCREFPNRGVCN